jgi:hypothetical protein
MSFEPCSGVSLTPSPDDLRQALEAITRGSRTTHYFEPTRVAQNSSSRSRVDGLFIYIKLPYGCEVQQFDSQDLESYGRLPTASRGPLLQPSRCLAGRLARSSLTCCIMRGIMPFGMTRSRHPARSFR